LAGYEDLNDAIRLASDPTFWLMGSKKIENWLLTSLQQRLIKTGGRLVKHACYYWLLGESFRVLAGAYHSTFSYLYS